MNFQVTRKIALLSNQIASFFDRQYLWLDALDFLHRDSYKTKIAFIGFGRVCPAMPRHTYV